MKLISVERTICFEDESHLYVVIESHSPPRNSKITIRSFDHYDQKNDTMYEFANKREMLSAVDNPTAMIVKKAIFDEHLFGLT